MYNGLMSKKIKKTYKVDDLPRGHHLLKTRDGTMYLCVASPDGEVTFTRGECKGKTFHVLGKTRSASEVKAADVVRKMRRIMAIRAHKLREFGLRGRRFAG
ncbi:MAG: hypothetical protein CMH32_00665 [Micavibrio sp.]|nr:hypothetical protein [Micavibrio sp.]|tara:strand:+ start:1431 stop:1733 length:303 start_codon:yes stop_codon:yes gene_type:complete